MKRNLIVMGGVAILIITGIFIPAFSFLEKKWYMPAMETIYLTSGASICVGLIVLWFMQSNSKWRGLLWIVLSIVGPFLTFNEFQRQYESFILRGIRIDHNYISGKPSYEIGFFLILIGYIVVIVGSVWDIVQKRRQEKPAIVPSQSDAERKNTESLHKEKAG